MAFVKSENIGQLVAALLEAKKTFDPVLKQSENPFFKRNGQNSKYADLATAIHATENQLAANGLAISQFPVNDGDRVGVFTLLVHTSGEYYGDSFTLALGEKQNAQTGVAAVTYARRTGYLAVLGVAAEDDDGNTAAGRTSSDEPSYEAPDFQDARRAEPAPRQAARPAAAPKVQAAAKPTASAVSTSKPAAQSTATPISSGAPAPAVVPSETASAPAAEREPGDEPVGSDDAVPNEEQLKPFRALFQKLGDDLSTVGKLKSSKGLPINRKLLVWLLAVVGAADAKAVTIGQWKKFFSRIDSTKATFGDEAFVKLAGLVNEANGIEVAAKK